MSSDEAQIKYYGEKRTHRASEGKKVQVTHKGPVKDTIQDIIRILNCMLLDGISLPEEFGLMIWLVKNLLSAMPG